MQILEQHRPKAKKKEKENDKNTWMLPKSRTPQTKNSCTDCKHFSGHFRVLTSWGKFLLPCTPKSLGLPQSNRGSNWHTEHKTTEACRSLTVKDKPVDLKPEELLLLGQVVISLINATGWYKQHVGLEKNVVTKSICHFHRSQDISLYD